MIKYMMNFGVYTIAMIGIIITAVSVYKKTISAGNSPKSTLRIDDKIMLNARKSLYVVNAGGERFLIAGDMDNTSLIAKLDDKKKNISFPEASDKGERNADFAQDISKPLSSHKKTFQDALNTAKISEFEKAFLSSENTANQVSENDKIALKNRYLDIQNIRKKPVMKELARKLAQV